MSEASSSVVDPRAISRDIFSATIGSVCCCYTGQPLDTIKVSQFVVVVVIIAGSFGVFVWLGLVEMGFL